MHRSSSAFLGGVAALALLAACSSGSGSDAVRSGTTANAAPTTTASPTTVATTTAPPTTDVVANSALTGDVAFLGPIRTVAVGRLTMAFRQFGTGPDLLLVAGQGSSMSLWPATMLRELARAHRVTIYDNRQLGGTTGGDGPFTLPDLADDAAGLIGALGLSKPAVFGWSTGGEIGLLLTIRHPDAVGRLAITGAYPGGPRSVLPPESVNALFADPNPDVNKLFEVLFSTTPEGAAAKDAFLADYVKVPQPTETPAATAAYDVAERRYWSDPEPDLASIHIPVLVMNGNGDFAVPSANATFIADRIGPSAQLELDDGGRHAWFLEHPDHFRALMTAFLA